MKKLYIDIGGTHIRSEIVEGDDVYHELCSSHEIGLFGYIEKQIARHRDISFVGIAYAGQVNNGEIIASPNINIDEYQIRSAIRDRYGIRLEIDNDINCAVRAEAAYWNSVDIAALYVGTGIGAALIDHGNLVEGKKNMSFEIGHIPYRETPFRCGCGRTNCIELYASGSGMEKWLRHYGSDGTVDLKRLRRSASEHESRVIAEFEEALLHAAGVVATLADSEILVLGGGVMTQNPYLGTLLRKKLNDYALHSSLDGMRIETSALTNAPLMGAKLLENVDG